MFIDNGTFSHWCLDKFNLKIGDKVLLVDELPLEYIFEVKEISQSNIPYKFIKLDPISEDAIDDDIPPLNLYELVGKNYKVI